MRIVFDTNVLIRVFLNPHGAAAALLDLLRPPHHDIVLSDGILIELRRVLEYPRVRSLHGKSDTQVEHFLGSLRTRGVLVVPAVGVSVTSDPDDNQIIATAIAGSAAVLCTLDHHLRKQSVIDYCARHGIDVMTDSQLLLDLRRGQGS